MKRLTKVLIAVGAVVAIGGGAAVALGSRSKGPDKRDMATVTRGSLEVTVAETGTVQPLTKVEVKSRIAGQVAQVFVDVGDRVKKGQPVIQLDTTDLQREVARSQADVAAARAQLDKLRAGARKEERAQARAETEQARAEVARAEGDFRRARSGLESETLTVREFDQARAEVETARARLAAARARQALVEAGSRPEDVAAAVAQLARAEVALQAARDQLAYATIRAPMDGVVMKRGIEAGEFVSPGVSALAQGGAILTIADLSKLVISTALNQVDVGRVRKGLPVEVRVDSAPDRVFGGTIRKVAPAAEAGKEGQNAIQTFTVETLVSAGEREAAILRPGMTADLDIKVVTVRGVLLLPVEAVVRGKGNEATVTLPGKSAKDAKKPETRAIVLGLSNDREVEIKSGLKEGDKVVIKPPSAAENSMKF
ncbi:MAG: efflux RND transporter periplasmic adaptor subunit [Candidatus Sericytochromatia bacterium]|nr:efflux RND transporter periplasmic adaptor subunit [Candidatus Tanganyikabacteria bacterium]